MEIGKSDLHFRPVSPIPLGDEPHIDSLAFVLHGLAEFRVVFQLVIVLFELVFGPCAFLRISVDVGFEPRLLLELQDTVNLSEMKSWARACLRAR